MHYLSQNGTAQSIKDISTSSLRDGFEFLLSTLTAELDGVPHLM